MAASDGRYPSIFVDSHAHLADAAFAGDRDDVISRARDAGAAAIVCIGESLAAAKVASAIAIDNPGFVVASAGIHPHYAAGFDAARGVPLLRALWHESDAVGGWSLEYHYDNSLGAAQRQAFPAQGQLA